MHKPFSFDHSETNHSDYYLRCIVQTKSHTSLVSTYDKVISILSSSNSTYNKKIIIISEYTEASKLVKIYLSIIINMMIS